MAEFGLRGNFVLLPKDWVEFVLKANWPTNLALVIPKGRLGPLTLGCQVALWATIPSLVAKLH